MAVEAVDPSFDQLDALLSGTTPSTPMAAAEMTNPNGDTPPVEPAQPAAEPATTEPAEPAAAAEPGEAAVPAEVPVEATASEPGHREPGWVDKRLSSLAAKRREAEADARIARQEAADLKARNDQLQRDMEALRTGATPPAASGNGQPAARTTQPAAGEFDKPKPVLKEFTQPGGKFFTEGEDYDDAVQRHSEALLDWRDESRAFQDAKAYVDGERQKQTDVFVKDTQSAMDEIPDFEDARGYVLSHSSDALQVAISNLPRLPDGKAVWPKVVSYLADNPDILASLEHEYSENPYAVAAKLGQISAQLVPATPGRARAAAPAAATPPAEPRRAPTPPKTVGGNAAPAPPDLESLPMDLFAAEIRKYMK